MQKSRNAMSRDSSTDQPGSPITYELSAVRRSKNPLTTSSPFAKVDTLRLLDHILETLLNEENLCQVVTCKTQQQPDTEVQNTPAQEVSKRKYETYTDLQTRLGQKKWVFECLSMNLLHTRVKLSFPRVRVL